MNALARIKNLSNNLALLSGLSLRSHDHTFFPSINIFGGNVSKRQAIKLSAVYTCLNILGETFGCLPFDVKQDTKSGRITRKDLAVHRLIHDRPNVYTNAFDFWSAVVKLIKGWGNCFVRIDRDRFFDPVALWLLWPEDVQVLHANDRLVYLHKGKKIEAFDILHFKNFSLDGILGLSAIDENRLTIGHGKALKEHNANLVKTMPPGYLTAETPPRDSETKANIKKMWSGDQSGEIPLLYGGVAFKTFSLPADAVAYIESSDLTEQEIYGIFRIPPTLAQNYKRATFSNAEQQDLVFSKYSLAMRTGIEQECNAKLFTEKNATSEEPLYTKFNLKGILAGDIKTRKEFYQSMITLGVFSQNDVLRLEDMETFEGGDRHYIQGAMVPLDMIDEFVKKGKTTPSVSDEQRKLLRQILNGKYQEVIDILQ